MFRLSLLASGTRAFVPELLDDRCIRFGRLHEVRSEIREVQLVQNSKKL